MDGIIIIDKEKGYTSHDIIAILRKVLNIKKIGHIGTLDPNATGVLPILIGQATKVSKYLIEHDKTYISKIAFGEERDTGDIEGKVIETKDTSKLNLQKENIEEVLNMFLGKQKQIPPMYSAIKVNGKKLYEYARENKEVEVQKRDIEIYSIKLLDIGKDEITFEVKCSKGTYIRTLCEDIAEKLGTVGYMKDLRRVEIDKFNIQNGIKIGDIKENIELARANLITIEEVFKEIEDILIGNKELEQFLNGVMITKNKEDGLYKIYSDNKFIGLGIIKEKILKRDVVI